MPTVKTDNADIYYESHADRSVGVSLVGALSMMTSEGNHKGCPYANRDARSARCGPNCYQS